MNQIAQTQPTTNVQLIGMAQNDFSRVSVDKQITWDAECNFALQLINKNDFLCKTAWNNQQSLGDAIVNISAIGISLNPALKHAYLVPREGQVCLDVSYMGLIHLAGLSGRVEWVQAKLVHKNDSYINKGIDKEPHHEYEGFSDRGPIVGVFCVMKTIKGDYLTEEMSLEDVYKIRDRSMAYSRGKVGRKGPWESDEGEMIKKTVVKRAAKYWPKVKQLDDAIHMLNVDSGEGIDFDEEQKPKVSKVTRPGNAPTTLPDALREQYFLIKESMDAGDYQVAAEKIAQFEMVEEMLAVWRCFASNERTAYNKFGKSEDFVKIVNPEKMTYLKGEELDKFLEGFNG